MTANQYNEVFETIKSNLVPKVELVKSKLENAHLKSELEIAKEELKKIKLKYEEEKLKNDIIQAEKESLESEKKTFELKFNELSLKLKLKSSQYDSLLSSEETGCKSTISAETQTVKQEPSEISIVNVPASSSSGIGIKRTSSVSADDQRKKAKRKKTARSNSTTGTGTRNSRKSTQNERKFTCERCIDLWGEQIEEDFGGDPDREDAPDPRQIPAFSSFEALKTHNINVHGCVRELFCEEKGCLHHKEHSEFAPHGKNICGICDLSFKFKKHLDQHVAYGHVDYDMTKKQFYDLYLKYKDAFY